MADSSLRPVGSRSHSESSSKAFPRRETEGSLVAALKRIVRRVLRTQSHRTVFEGKILDTARHLLERHRCFLTRDALERLVVEELLHSSQEGQAALPPLADEAPCPYTQITICDSTFAL